MSVVCFELVFVGLVDDLLVSVASGVSSCSLFESPSISTSVLFSSSSVSFPSFSLSVSVLGVFCVGVAVELCGVKGSESVGDLVGVFCCEVEVEESLWDEVVGCGEVFLFLGLVDASGELCGVGVPMREVIISLDFGT